MHFICDVDYFEFCKNVWYFLDIMFYKTEAAFTEKRIPASVRELKAQLCVSEPYILAEQS